MTLLPVLDPGFHTPSRGEQATSNRPVEHSHRAERAEQVSKPEFASPIDFCNLAAEIERNGIGSIEPSLVAELAHRGLTCGMHPDVVALITDSSAPAVVRERAFGLLHRFLVN
ncbi:MAG: hypothetical protein ACRBK7_27620 [Acidimicrobiales bacterium]